MLTGQMPTDPAAPDAPLPNGIEAQTRRVMANLALVLGEIGLGLEHVVQCRCYLTAFERDYAAFNETYASHFPADRLPARTTIGVTALAVGALRGDRRLGEAVLTYANPLGGLPSQSEITGDRAVFTEAYAVLTRRTMADITTSRLPGWNARAWVIARPMTGFTETFSHMIVEVEAGRPGGGRAGRGGSRASCS